MTSEHVPDTKDTPLIEQALQRRLEADTLRKSKELEERKKREDRDAFVKLITSQFYREIIEPLKVFISDFNSRYHGDKIILSPGTSTTLGHNISTPSGISIRLQIEPILTENFEREVIIATR